MKPEMKPEAGLFSKSLSLLLGALVFCGGCKTYEKYSPTCNLWNQDNQPSFCQPKADPKLALFDVPASQEVLVVYDCGSERHPGSRRRAYFLEASRANITTGRPPQFVNPKLAHGLPSICVIKQYSFEADPDATNTWARMQQNAFTLHRPGQSPENCPLPVYQDYFPKPDSQKRNWWRVALTPITVPLDVTVGVAVTVVVVGTATAEIWTAFLPR